jgi:hypothetical protein
MRPSYRNDGQGVLSLKEKNMGLSVARKSWKEFRLSADG